MNLVRIWLTGSAVVIGGLFLWAFAPFVFFLLALTGAIGLVAAAAITGARWLERLRRD